MTPTGERGGHDQLTNAAAWAWFGELDEPIRRSSVRPRMLLRADMYRQKAAEAKRSAARSQIPFLETAFEEVASGWLLLAEQTEWIDREWERKTGPDEPS